MYFLNKISLPAVIFLFAFSLPNAILILLFEYLRRGVILEVVCGDTWEHHGSFWSDSLTSNLDISPYVQYASDSVVQSINLLAPFMMQVASPHR